MSLTEFDQEEYDRNRFNDGKEAGIAIGIAEGKRDAALQNARNFKYKNIPVDIIAECTGLSVEQVNTKKKKRNSPFPTLTPKTF